MTKIFEKIIYLIVIPVETGIQAPQAEDKEKTNYQKSKTD
jgi:hypothetical protein